MRLKIRDARNDDGDRLIELIGACYADYPGCILDVDGEVPELRAIATHYAEMDGRFWVAEGEGGLLGSVGIAPGKEPGVFEVKKLYVAKEARRMGLGQRLLGLAEVEAMSRGARAIDLWSDTRFEDSHRLYERRGYTRGESTRELHDASNSVEHYFRKEIAPAGV